MNEYKDDYIQYRVIRSKETLDDACTLAAKGSWNSAMNRLYYACYYMVSALLLKDGVETKSHAGLKNQFSLHYVKTGLISKSNFILYSGLMDSRQLGDYGDLYDFTSEDVEPLLVSVQAFWEELELFCIKPERD